MVVTKEETVNLAQSVGWAIPEHEIEEFAQLLEKGRKAFETVAAMEDYQPVPDFAATPRNNVHFPSKEDNPLNGWAWRCDCTHTQPTSDLLKGKTLCLKDNIAMAGVPCLYGTDTFTDWTPKTDATVVSRILAAGGTIAGKSVCENLSRGAVSMTAATGPVDNPFAKGYSAGGSSSGTGALVGSGAVDMGLGCDQGGSIRIPAALCGLYGMKATLGLVPYTAIASIGAEVDFVGPMTRTCMDCATLLQTIAGVDGLDDRQIAGTPFPGEVPKYAKLLEQSVEQGVKGLRIGILKEGLSSPATSPVVEAKFRAAVEKFRELGATVEEISVPIHEQAPTIYGVISKMGNHMGMLGKATARRQVMLTDLYEKKGLPYTQDKFEKLSQMSKDAFLVGELGWKEYATVYPKAVNLMRKVKEDYDAALAKVDVLVMPTCVTPANKLPPVDVSPTGYAASTKGKLENTCSFNGTGHPALAMPIGLVEPVEPDGHVKLPVSLQIVGRFWDESTLFRAAYAWERAVDWKTF